MLHASYRPSSISGADDAVNISGILADIAGKGKLSIVPNLSGNSFAIKTPIAVPSKSVIGLHQACLLVSSMSNTGTGGYTNSVFFATKTGVGSAVNLSADAVPGSNQISVASTTGVAKGTVIGIGFTVGGNQQQVATVLAVSGSVLTLDEIIRFPYWTVANGAFYYVLTPPADITLKCNGAKICGSGDRAVEFAFARNVHVDGLVVDQTLNPTSNGFLNIVMSFDIGCRDCSFKRCRVDGGGGYLTGVTATAGFALEANARGHISHCAAMNLTAAGTVPAFGIYDSTNCTLDTVSGLNCRIGVYIGSNDVNGTAGARGVKVQGLTTELCSTAGVQFDKASRASIDGWTDTGSTTSFSELGGADVHISHFHWSAPRVGTYNGWNAIFGTVNLTDGIIDMTSTSGTKAVCDWGSASTGTLRLDRVKSVAGDYGLYLEDAIAHRVILGDGVDFSSTTTPFRKGTTSKLAFGTIGAGNGSNSTMVAACTAKDSVHLTQLTGTPTTPPKLVSIGADTFTILALSGNSETYAWKIVRGGP